MTERKEIIPNAQQSFSFTIYRPGGNDTCLITGLVTDPQIKKRMNTLIMDSFPSVEQVGFISPDPTTPQLAMAGGEFCGNATRSTVYQYLAGNPGEMLLSVSGVAMPLRAGITEAGEAFAQMPIFPDPSKIYKDSDNPSNYFVEMEGITHYIDTTTDVSGLSKEEIKQQAYTFIKQKGLNSFPAAGVMYTKQQQGRMIIDPVVFVRDINTLFYETACGSGTTAVGLMLAQQTGASIKDLSVMQPSGLPINISIAYDGSSFGYAQISGPLESLSEGTIELADNGDAVIERIQTPLSIQTSLDELTALYNTVFGGPPYYEQFTSTEVEELFTQYVTQGMLFLGKAENRIIGFGAALPLAAVPEIATLTKKDRENTWYMADLGVLDSYRNRGYARKLVQARLQAIPPGTAVVMRTSINNIASQSLYKSLGFQQIPDVYQSVEQQRINGEKTTDTRLFLSKTV